MRNVSPTGRLLHPHQEELLDRMQFIDHKDRKDCKESNPCTEVTIIDADFSVVERRGLAHLIAESGYRRPALFTYQADNYESVVVNQIPSLAFDGPMINPPCSNRTTKSRKHPYKGSKAAKRQARRR